MIVRIPETAVILWGDRHVPFDLFSQQIDAIAASGVVDTVSISDQMVNFLPTQLWTTEHTPMAGLLSDPDSYCDAFTTTAYAIAKAPQLNYTVATDSVRRGPAEMVQTMLTLAHMAQGTVTFHIGAGEQKQCGPYGHRRSQGLARMEDLFEVVHKILDGDSPFDHDGNHWTLRKAWLGSARPARPKIWGLGGGPRLVDHTTSHADGICVAAPLVWATPEQAADEIAGIKRTLDRKGRDPDAFRFGMYCAVLLHEDEERVQRAYDNALVRWMSAVWGRIDPGDWAREGLPSPVPAGWTYYANLLPYDTPTEFVTATLDAVSRAHAEKSFWGGTVRQVADRIGAYIDAGVDYVLPIDYFAAITDPEDSARALGRTIELCGLLRGRGRDT